MSQPPLARARAGDQRAFAELVEPYRAELLLHCYRMLGSLTDAEDLLQETVLAAWLGIAGFEERASPRTWLYRIATNRCLNALRNAGRRPPTAPTPPFPVPAPTRRDEITWLQPYPDALLEGMPDRSPGPHQRAETREAVQLAFVASLQRMPPRQAATLILHDVLGFSTAEAAAMIGVSDTAAKGLLQRARARRDASHPRTGSATAVSRDRQDELARRFAEAFTADDVEAVIALLTDDAWLAMPPAPHRYHGAAAIAGFLSASAAQRRGRRFRLVATRANNQPAFGWYLPDGRAAGVIVLTCRADGLAAITRFHDAGLPARFGLSAPARTQPRAPRRR